MPLLVLCAVLSQPPGAEQMTFVETFDSVRSDFWSFSVGAPGKVAFEEGRLVLDLSVPGKGKWACADLHQSFTLPARIEWDQCLVHDSPHVWFTGLVVTSLSSPERGSLQAGLGGKGLHNSFFLGANGLGAEDKVQEAQWYHLVLELDQIRQVLTVTPHGQTEPVERLEVLQALSGGPFYLRFFQNDNRLGPDLPDAYDQDRGTTLIDNLRITSAKIEVRKPPPPGTTEYPYKIPIVRNRATRWLTTAEGVTRGCIAYEAAGWMPLTGARGVSRWLRLQRWVVGKIPEFPEDPCIAEAGDETTVFTLPQGAKEAVFVLRALQWNVEQHPTLEWQAAPQGVSWKLELTATDGVRAFLWRLWQGEESAVASDGVLDLLKTYRASGRPNRYAEVDFLVRIKAAEGVPADTPGSLKLRLGLPGRACVVSRSPMVVDARTAREKGAVLEAALVDADGRLVTDPSVSLEVEVAGRKATLDPVGAVGVRRVVLRDLSVGEHTARLEATDAQGKAVASGEAELCVTEMDFASHYERGKRSYCTRDGRATGPLLGDLFAWVLYSELGPASRHMVLGLEEYQRLTAEGRQVSYTKWRSLPRSDIDRYFEYYADSGVKIVRITPNVSVAEYYCDACGHLAMHGFEQLSYILAAARRHGIRCAINLTHYPYLYPGTGNNPPVAQYFEAGYRTQFDWTSDEMWQYLAGYFDEMIGFTGEDPVVMAYTLTGENDQLLPAAWINRGYELIKRRAPDQMVVLEQGGSIYECRGADPSSYAEFKPAADGGVGFRTYTTYQYPTDCFMAVVARFYDMAPPSFWGEVCCGGANVAPQFICKLRDALGLTLTLQQTMLMAWSAPPLEGECRAFMASADLIDWTSFRRARPPVAIIVDKPDRQQVKRLVAYEEALQSMAVDCEYVRPGTDTGGYALVLDARAPEVDQGLVEKLRALRGQLPLVVSSGNHVTYALSQDRQWLVAHVRNATRYEILPCDVGPSIELCRMPDQERSLTVDLQGLARDGRYVVWDVASARKLGEGLLKDGAARLDLGNTTADVLVVVTPLP